MPYVVYHLHSDYSLLDSCSKFQEYVDRAVSEGMTAIASTEHGIPRGWVEKKLICDKAGIKFIHGVEIYLTESLEEKVKDNFHTVLLAKNEDGIRELNTLIELSTREDHTYYKNRLTFDEFLAISPNIIKISACLQSPLSKLPRYHERYLELAKHYDYLEIQHHNTQGQKEYNKHLYALSKRIGVPLIAGTDTHASSEYKGKCREILMEYKGQHYEDEESFDLVWKTYDELVHAYEVQDALPRYVYVDAIANTQAMADSVNDFKLDMTPKYPILYGSPQADEDKLIERTWSMLEDKLNNGVIPREQEEEFRRNIQEELDAFHVTNMSGFMLSMSEIISWCRNTGKPIGPCRGSVGGSCVAYVTDIIDLNPVTYHTVFSRFCNPSRIELGDIDVDCIESDRPAIFEYIIDKFGADRCARVASYGTIADLSFVDDCGGGLGIMWEREHHKEKFDDKGKFNKAKKFDEENPYHPKKLEKIKSEYKADNETAKQKYTDLFRYFDGIVGTKISQSVHPAGMVIASVTLGDNYGVFNKDGEQCLYIAMDEAHDVMLVKYDLLILKTVNVISDCCRLAGKQYPRMHEIDFHDKAVWDDICKDQSTIFQFESEFAASSLAKFRPRSIEDVTVVNAAIRPSGLSYRDNLLAHIPHKNPTAQIDAVMKDSLGYLVYQEQTIEFLRIICGLTGGEADTVRRAITKKQKDKVDAWIPKILEGYCANSDKPRAEAEQEAKEYLKVIEDSSGYGFGKNHSTGYSMLSYLCGYYRHYYPEEYVAAYMSAAANDEDIATGKELMKRLGIQIVQPRFREDNRTFYIDKKNHTITDALSTIKGVGLKDAEALWNLSCGFYPCFTDLLFDVMNVKGALNKTVMDTLIRLDYFSEFGSAGKLLAVYAEFTTGKNRITSTLKQDTINKRMAELYRIESEMQESELDMEEDVPFQISVLGAPVKRYPDKKMCYAVLDVDDKYSPKMKLYSLSTGNVGIMKTLKATYKPRPVKVGDIIVLGGYKVKPAYQYVGGEHKVIPGSKEIWIDSYMVLPRKDKKE